MRQRHARGAVGERRWCRNRWIAPHAEVTKRRGGLSWRGGASIGGVGGGTSGGDRVSVADAERSTNNRAYVSTATFALVGGGAPSGRRDRREDIC